MWDYFIIFSFYSIYIIKIFHNDSCKMFTKKLFMKSLCVSIAALQSNLINFFCAGFHTQLNISKHDEYILFGKGFK